MKAQAAIRFPLMAMAGLSLLTALWAGLARLGWSFPQPSLELPSNHGPLMIVGFLGTLISLERAVALEKRWAYCAPLFAALAGLALILGLPHRAAHLLGVIGSLFLVVIFLALYRRHPSAFLTFMGMGAFLWFAGNLLWLTGFPLNQTVPWWTGFLVLTIAGERWELSRLIRLSARDLFRLLFASGLFLGGLLLSLVAFGVGVWIMGIGLIALAFWLLRYDIAWHTVRHPGLPRFMAICLLCGYIWLGIGGLLWVVSADLVPAGPAYDAMLHTIFLGFIFSMIFAHAPIIFPSITGIPISFRRAFYAHLALLHLSLLLRLAGDLAASVPGRKWGGLLNVVAIFLFLANCVYAARSAQSGD